MRISFERTFDYETSEHEETRSILREVEIARLIEKHTEKAISHCQPETSLILWRQASAIAM